jgi:hypothetical protein
MDSSEYQHPRPELTQWYQMPDGTTFMIIAMDDDDDSIEIQYFDGTIEEWDSELWERAELVPIDEPEDAASGPFDELDYSDQAEDERISRYDNPLDGYE